MPEKAQPGKEDPHRFDEELARIPSQLVGHLLGTEDPREIARAMMVYYREYGDLDDLNRIFVRRAFILFRSAIGGSPLSLCQLADEVVYDGLHRWGSRALHFLGRYSILGPSSPFEGSFVPEAVFASVLYLCLQDHREEWGLIDQNQTVVIGFCSKFTPIPVVGRFLTRMALRMVQVCGARLLPSYLLFLTIVARLVNNPVRPEDIVLAFPAECSARLIEGLQDLASEVAEDPKVWQRHADYSEYVGDTFVTSDAMRQDFVLACHVLSARLGQSNQRGHH